LGSSRRASAEAGDRSPRWKALDEQCCFVTARLEHGIFYFIDCSASMADGSPHR
jgi:hypothetical protein